MILLDMNALLWLVADSPRLGPEARERIGSADQVCFSAVSVSEIAIKHMLGRIALPGADAFPRIFAESGLRELPFTAHHAATLLEDPDLRRHDPFDRMLLAQASAERAELLTSDSVLLGMGRSGVVDARR